LIGFAYAWAGVFHRYSQEFIVLYANRDFYATFSSELDCIRLQIDQYLHDSLLIMIDNWIMTKSPVLVESHELWFKSNTFSISLSLLDTDNLFDDFPYVEVVQLLSETSSFDKWIVDEIFHQVSH
jgi:hypothetical protein